MALDNLIKRGCVLTFRHNAHLGFYGKLTKGSEVLIFVEGEREFLTALLKLSERAQRYLERND
jgi:hypothetical protein